MTKKTISDAAEKQSINPEYVLSILEKHNGNRGSLIAILEAVQAKYGYLPEDTLNVIANKTEHSLVDIYSVVTFYRSFSLKPRGKHLISVCLGTACHVRNAPMIVEEFERRLGINSGDTTQDREFTLETVACLGACALGPIVVADGHYFSNVTATKVKKILKKTQAGLEDIIVETDERIFPIGVGCSRCNHSLMDPNHLIGGHPSIRITMAFNGMHGWLRLSSLYGNYKIDSEYEIPQDTIINLFCPHCHTEMIGASDCTECGAPMVPMIVREGGMIQICSRLGCKEHMLDLSGVNL